MRACVLIIGMAALCALVPQSARGDTIVVLSDYWHPYNGQPGAKSEGYKIDLMRAIAEANGHAIDYRLIDWELALSRTLSGTGGDCVVGAFESDAPRHARTSEPWGISQNAILGHVDRMPEIRDLEALRGLRIGVVADYSYGDALDELFAEDGIHVVRVQSSRRAFPALVIRLVTKRVDVIVEEVNVAKVGLRELKMSESVRAVDVDFLEPAPIYVACTPNARGHGFAHMFDIGLKKARADGRLQYILDRYDLQDWKRPEQSEK
jgi:polar amino acid transport system substrate-binding protein